MAISNPFPDVMGAVRTWRKAYTVWLVDDSDDASIAFDAAQKGLAETIDAWDKRMSEMVDVELPSDSDESNFLVPPPLKTGEIMARLVDIGELSPLPLEFEDDEPRDQADSGLLDGEDTA